MAVKSSRMTEQVEESECDERTAGNDRKGISDPRVDGHAAPNNQNAQSCREENVTSSGNAGDGECPGPIPLLRMSCNDKGQPVRRNGRMQTMLMKTTSFMLSPARASQAVPCGFATFARAHAIICSRST